MIPGSERSPGEGDGNPLQYSCLENSMDKRALQATIHRVAKNWTQLSNSCTLFTYLLSSRQHIMLTKVRLVKGMVFPIVTYGYESWTIKQAKCQRIDAFECGAGEDS